ncbi:MAG: dTDP-4-amino-4,6-dideoxygalactose transaminase [Dermatophilaceae bacterium]|nr:dTDP-4-amino-4,6-dideoxygalactose transaminase [Intrasporangiaceae bacterium]
MFFTTPYVTGLESEYLAQALQSGHWQGDGPFTARATSWLEAYTGAHSALLTTSCTHALELAAILLDLGPGDEVIVPSFTFSSTATAVAIRGATPVFVDVLPETLNIDPQQVAEAVTPATKAVFFVHYGGVAADLDALQAVADEHGLALVEDNAHALGGYFRGRHLGTFGTFATQSWHATKNVACGEGGALLINDPAFVERAEVIREKGTNRSRFLRGQVDKYTWVDQGSSYLPSELLAAVLAAQFECFEEIQDKRHRTWRAYDSSLPEWAAGNGVGVMTVPDECEHPAHLYYLIMSSPEDQEGIIQHLKMRGITAPFHYQPLDTAPAGRSLGRSLRPCTVTADRAARLVRLPLHAGLSEDDVARVIDGVMSYRSGG